MTFWDLNKIGFSYDEWQSEAKASADDHNAIAQTSYFCIIRHSQYKDLAGHFAPPQSVTVEGRVKILLRDLGKTI